MEFAELIKTPKVDNVIMHRPPLHGPTEVVLCITSHHLILSSRTSRNDEIWVSKSIRLNCYICDLVFILY